MRISLTSIFLTLAVALATSCCASPNRVLVVENLSSPASVKIAQYYFHKRHIPPIDLCTIRCSTAEYCSTDDGMQNILAPVRQYIHTRHLDIDYIVLTKGIPIKFNYGDLDSFAVDSVMTTLDDPLPKHALNPYYAATDRFTHREYGIYLVTRLDGWTVDDCLRLVDHGLATKPGPGPIYLHTAINRDTPGYYDANQAIRDAGADLVTENVNVYLDQSEVYHTSALPLMGYYSWGTNDPDFDVPKYESLVFAPGAIAETVVSSSGRTFDNHADVGQSLIADLIRQGVTGCKGYVSEPYVDAMAHADILFDHYTQGWNLADSFYAASRFVNWKDIVIGDPLCDPYGSNPKRPPGY